MVPEEDQRGPAHTQKIPFPQPRLRPRDPTHPTSASVTWPSGHVTSHSYHHKIPVTGTKCLVSFNLVSVRQIHSYINYNMDKKLNTSIKISPQCDDYPWKWSEMSTFRNEYTTLLLLVYISTSNIMKFTFIGKKIHLFLFAPFMKEVLFTHILVKVFAIDTFNFIR